MNVILSDSVRSNDGSEIYGNSNSNGITNYEIQMLNSFYHLCSYIVNLKNFLPPLLHDIPDVYILIIKNKFRDNAISIYNFLNNQESVNNERITGINFDTHYYKPSNKKYTKHKGKSRIVFADLGENYKYDNNLNTVYNINKISEIIEFKDNFNFLGSNIMCEINKYHDNSEPMIKSKEQRSYVGLCCSPSGMKLQFMWNHKSLDCLQYPISIDLEFGDSYIMSSLATGSKEGLTKLFIKHKIIIN